MDVRAESSIIAVDTSASVQQRIGAMRAGVDVQGRGRRNRSPVVAGTMPRYDAAGADEHARMQPMIVEDSPLRGHAHRNACRSAMRAAALASPERAIGSCRRVDAHRQLEATGESPTRSSRRSGLSSLRLTHCDKLT